MLEREEYDLRVRFGSKDLVLSFGEVIGVKNSGEEETNGFV